MSSDGGDTGLINHAVQAMTSAAGAGSIDMASVLAKIQSLEREKQVMAATLESNNARSCPHARDSVIDTLRGGRPIILTCCVQAC
jgi:hypothetical protein